MEIKTNVINIGKQNIFYRYTGEGFPLVLLHGSHQSSYLWIRNMPALGKHFTVYAPDRPGYGESDAIDPRDTLPDMVQFAIDFLHVLGHKTANWIGESRGGGIAIQLAAKYPEAVQKLVLVNSIGLPPNELPKPPEVGNRSRWEWFIERSFHNPTFVTEEMRQVVMANLEKAQKYEQLRLDSVPPEYNKKGLLEDIIRIKCPTLVIWSRQDPVFPVESAERFRHLIPTIQDVVIIDNARHIPHYEHPDIFNQPVLRFLLGQEDKMLQQSAITGLGHQESEIVTTKSPSSKREKILGSKVLFSGKKFTVKQLEIELAPGKIVNWEVVDKGGNSVAMVPVDKEGFIYLVEEYFGATDERTLCLPKGMVDEGETPEEAALRELQEEIGMKGRAQELVTLSVSPGYLTQKTILFLMTDLEPSQLVGDEEQHLSVVRLSMADAIVKIKNGDITEARTIGGITLAKIILEL